MRASAIHPKSAASFEGLKPACQVLILHEDFPAYARAVEVCRRVMERFARELDFSIKCWNFIELADPNCARHAAKTAGSADIILFSVRTAALPAEIEHWLEACFAVRWRKEGVIALVMTGGEEPSSAREALAARLNKQAGRLGLDFLMLLPGDDAAAITPARPAAAWREVRAAEA
jgi:hypothetical protein